MRSDQLEVRASEAMESDVALAAAKSAYKAKLAELAPLLQAVRDREDALIAQVKSEMGITELTSFECCLAESRAGVC